MRLPHAEADAFGVAVELGRVHALNLGDSRLVLAAELNPRRVFKDIDALGQVIDEEVAGGVARRFVVRQAILILVSRVLS